MDAFFAQHGRCIEHSLKAAVAEVAYMEERNPMAAIARILYEKHCGGDSSAPRRGCSAVATSGSRRGGSRGPSSNVTIKWQVGDANTDSLHNCTAAPMGRAVYNLST